VHCQIVIHTSEISRPGRRIYDPFSPPVAEFGGEIIFRYDNDSGTNLDLNNCDGHEKALRCLRSFARGARRRCPLRVVPLQLPADGCRSGVTRLPQLPSGPHRRDGTETIIGMQDYFSFDCRCDLT
jgi:hypothetical protein